MPRFSFHCALLAIGAALLVPSAVSGDDRDLAARIEFFEKRIRPVLVERCYECHSAQAKSVKGGLHVDSGPALLRGGDSGAAIVPGKPQESLLIQALKYESVEMPPKGKLPANVIADFERWIGEGAVDPRQATADDKPKGIDYAKAAQFWAFRMPEKSELPRVSTNARPLNDIDRFVYAELDANNLSPSAPAAANVLIRRISFSLVGLPPTPTEVAAFEKEHARDSETTIRNLVDRLLDSPHYGERWARHWLDVARYGEDQAHTFKARKYPRGYYYRDWVVQSLNDDLPYDQFLLHQIAADLVPGPDQHKRLPALGLFALGPVYYAENVEKAKATADEWDDRIDTLMRGVLGLTASCARCHDHKYDPISMQDYYGLAGVFASTQYQERPVASDDDIAKKRKADAAASQQQLATDRFLTDSARDLRDSLVDEIPRYMLAVVKVLDGRKAEKNEKKLIEKVAKQEKLSPVLLGRWVEFLTKSGGEFVDRDLFQAGADENKIRQAAESFQKLVRSKLSRKAELFARHGINVAFVKAADRADVEPGVIPLGNLFDDTANVTLDAALSTDRFKAAASDKSLGVDRVVQGWGGSTKIAPDVSFDFRKLGSDSRAHGSIVNDAWNTDGGIRTSGQRFRPDSPRTEQGIGMHANALITFDLDKIRRAGLMPMDQQFVFKVDRAGINDDVAGSSSASAHMAVIVSKPHKNKNTSDAIIAAYINGQQMELATDDFTYYVSGEIPPPLRSDGRFVSFSIDVPADATHVTLVTTGAGSPDDNSISSDHTVFSGARLEMNPLPAHQVARKQDAQPTLNASDLRDARLLSRLFYDEGLLALPAKEAEPRLPEVAKRQLAEMRKQHDKLKKTAASLTIPTAHAITDGRGTDLPVYLQGDPAKKGQVVPRAMPAIFTAGQRQPFSVSGSGRLQLAHAIASPNNPLTARVIVNRVWAGHFGFGLVRTPSNFGQLGQRPSHPKLLDYLAVRFVEEGWSLKWLHRVILSSATFAQSSDFDAANYEVDPENRLLWRMNRRRLEIEPWRDSMLAVSGELDRKLGGPPINLGDANNKRRTLYGFISRHRLDELLRLFDFPDPNITADSRSVTTVPLQQLFVLNSDFMAQRALGLAKRLHDKISGDDSERISYAFQLLYGRNPDEQETQLGIEFLGATQDKADRLSAWEQYALVLLGANEFMYVD